MGFFSELKEDLSQAVNELLPMDEQSVEGQSADTQPAEDNSNQETTPDEIVTEMPETEESEGISGDVSLEEMLENIDEIEMPEMPKDEIEEPSLEEMLAAALADLPEQEDEDNAEQTSMEQAIAEAVVSDETAPVETVFEAETVAETVQEEEIAPETIPEEKDVQESEPATREESKGAEEKMDSYASRQAVDETAVITNGMQIHGDVISEGSLDIIGTVDGNIDILGKLNVTGHVNGNSKAAEIYAEGAKINGEIISAGAVKIGDSSVIIGNITAKSAAIAGAVKGDIDVQGPVVLDSSAIVMGNIKSKSVQINNGAVIEGMCSQCYADVSPTSFFDDYKPETKSSKKKS